MDLRHGDCLEVMRTMTEASVDSIVTDPPYGLSFMGKRWDYDVPSVEIWAECLRVLKPGGHLLSFAGTRTQHRMACRIEDAGFDIRDMLAWVYGSGFPKSRNLEGAWDGWGTALKPALEPITLARKPLAGTVEANVLAHGVGALNIDGCRIATAGEDNPSIERRNGSTNHLSTRSAAESEADGKIESRQSPEAYSRPRPGDHLGRWPANLIHDGSDEVVSNFPSEAGAAAPVTVRNSDKFQGTYGAFKGNVNEQGSTFQGDSGSAARFFYCAKATREDRNDGCEAMEEKPLLWSSGTKNPGSFQAEGTNRASQNNHPTVKPTELMRWMCRLITPPRGIVLDPFMGSGSTGRAAALEGFRFIGIERDISYIAIARARIGAASAQGLLFA